MKGHLGLPYLMHQRQYTFCYSVLLLSSLLCAADNIVFPLESHCLLSPKYSFILVSVYEFLQVKGPIIIPGIEILLPCLEYVPLYAENSFLYPDKTFGTQGRSF